MAINSHASRGYKQSRRDVEEGPVVSAMERVNQSVNQPIDRGKSFPEEDNLLSEEEDSIHIAKINHTCKITMSPRVLQFSRKKKTSTK